MSDKARTVSVATTVMAIRLGDPVDPILLERAIKAGYAHWIGGEAYITDKGRALLLRAAVQAFDRGDKS